MGVWCCADSGSACSLDFLHTEEFVVWMVSGEAHWLGCSCGDALLSGLLTPPWWEHTPDACKVTCVEGSCSDPHTSTSLINESQSNTGCLSGKSLKFRMPSDKDLLPLASETGAFIKGLLCSKDDEGWLGFGSISECVLMMPSSTRVSLRGCQPIEVIAGWGDVRLVLRGRDLLCSW